MPPGTVVGWLGTLGLTGTISFTPSVAPEGTILSYTATLTNPADHWVFGRLLPQGLALYLQTASKPADMIPTIAPGVSGTEPEFQHETPQGLELGLLLAPHASYSFSSLCANNIGVDDESDYVVYATIIYAPVGVADGGAWIVRGAGSFTVTVPTAGSTTTTNA